MTPETIIRRDLPLDQGRRVRFTFTVEIDVPIDEDVLQGEQRVTLHELEEWIASAGKFYSSDDLWTGLRRNYGASVLDHAAWLTDIGLPEDEVRFERIWEQHQREKNTKFWAPSRVWLDEIPAAGEPVEATDV